MGNTEVMASREIARGLLGDRYALEAQIGRGGMGVVWRAMDTRLGRHVAIKEVQLPPALSPESSSAIQARVLREARVAARLADPSAVTVYDTFREQGTSYIVMELVDAPTLREIVERGGPLDTEQAAGLGLAILSALERAHEQGIVHRDVKPDNIMITPGRGAKLADFGIASLKDDPTLTATGIVLGSPPFMAPEQAQDDDSGPPADLWALGATLYFAVEGVAPFDRGSPISTLTAVVYERPRPPTRAGPLEAVIIALLSKRPEDRPGPAEVRRALEAAATRGRSALWERDVAPRPRRAGPPATEGGRSRPRPPLAGAAALVAALAALGVVGFMALDGGRGDPPGRAGATGARTERGAPDARSSRTPPEQPSSGDEVGGPSPTDDTTRATTTAPGEWSVFTDEATGFEISHPPGWAVIPTPTDDDSVDFRDPDTGAYLRVDWTDSPGRSPQRAWLAYEESFAATHDDYTRIQITPTTFQGFEASLWEFTYSEGGTRLHAVDLGFVTGDYGFALNFQTHEDDWAAMVDLFDDFEASFTPPP